MEATKGIKPATPLPWDVDAFHQWREQDAAYIVHACNAYPRLVEALRYFAKAADPHGSSQWLGAWSELNALLRELGESA